MESPSRGNLLQPCLPPLPRNGLIDGDDLAVAPAHGTQRRGRSGLGAPRAARACRRDGPGALGVERPAPARPADRLRSPAEGMAGLGRLADGLRTTGPPPCRCSGPLRPRRRGGTATEAGGQWPRPARDCAVRHTPSPLQQLPGSASTAARNWPAPAMRWPSGSAWRAAAGIRGRSRRGVTLRTSCGSSAHRAASSASAAQPAMRAADPATPCRFSAELYASARPSLGRRRPARGSRPDGRGCVGACPPWTLVGPRAVLDAVDHVVAVASDDARIVREASDDGLRRAVGNLVQLILERRWREWTPSSPQPC